MTTSTTLNTPANGGQILTDERIADLYREAFKGMADRLCNAPQQVPPAVISFGRAIEADLRAALAAPAIPTVDRNAVLEVAVDVPKLSVWYGAMPESNGKSNFTAILHAGDIVDGITLDRSEYPDRVRYEADRARYLIGELRERPFILDYDADKRSDYVAPEVAQPAAQGAVWEGFLKSPEGKVALDSYRKRATTAEQSTDKTAEQDHAQ